MTTHFDYIIVGAGSAGCVLANRLTEDRARRVLLLEAGGAADRPEVAIPAAFKKLFKTDLDWDYETDPQEHLGGRRLAWPRGKMIGGSSSMNAMIYQRGHPAIYDGWADDGCTGWEWETLLPYFKRSEDQARGANPYHGVGGPMRVSDLSSPNPLSKAFVQAAKQAGFPPNEDFAGPQQRGFGLFQVTQRSGRRESAATAFLEPALGRPNLTIRTRARVTGLQWEGTRCVGVTYRRDGARQRVSADAEVIVSAGAINSPQLLMLSGVGPADDLAEFDIDPVVDLPGVGRNLQDHPVAFLCQVCTQPVSLAAAESATNLAKYLAGGTGMLTSNVGEAGGFIHSGEDEGAIPDIQFHFAPAYFIEHGRVEPPGHGFTIGPTLVMPHSRGYITLRSADPFDSPTVEPRYLADERDGTRLVRGLEIARRIAAAPAFDRYRGAEYLPGRRADDPAALLSYVRRSLETLYHPAGTCKMATADDPEAVVDPELRVHGTEGLRVVDASIMPTLVNANTHAPTTMIAERAADLIRHEQ